MVTYRQATEPNAGVKIGDIWIKEGAGVEAQYICTEITPEYNGVAQNAIWTPLTALGTVGGTVVTSVAGTPGEVAVDASTGDVTVSLDTTVVSSVAATLPIDVSDSTGSVTISTDPANAEATVVASVAATTITNVDTWYPITAGWGSDITPVGFTLTPGSGTVTALRAGRYFMAATVAFTSAEAPNTIKIGIFKNAAVIPEHIAITWLDTDTYPNTVTISGIDDLAVNDVLALKVLSSTNGSLDIVFSDINFSVFQIS